MNTPAARDSKPVILKFVSWVLGGAAAVAGLPIWSRLYNLHPFTHPPASNSDAISCNGGRKMPDRIVRSEEEWHRVAKFLGPDLTRKDENLDRPFFLDGHGGGDRCPMRRAPQADVP